jgi:hypothetical protein
MPLLDKHDSFLYSGLLGYKTVIRQAVRSISKEPAAFMIRIYTLKMDAYNSSETLDNT